MHKILKSLNAELKSKLNVLNKLIKSFFYCCNHQTVYIYIYICIYIYIYDSMIAK